MAVTSYRSMIEVKEDRPQTEWFPDQCGWAFFQETAHEGHMAYLKLYGHQYYDHP